MEKLNKEQWETIQKHSEEFKREVGCTLTLEECTKILMEFYNEMNTLKN